MAFGAANQPIPHRVLGLYDRPFWELLSETKRLHLQRCSDCDALRYPPGPVCHECLSPEYEWSAVSGDGTILSWVIFHRKYLDAYPPPYNVIAIRLNEGPIFISNLEGEPPAGSWIDRRVRLRPVSFAEGEVLPRFELA